MRPWRLLIRAFSCNVAAFATMVGVLSPASVQAAEITVRTDPDANLIDISGTFVKGDAGILESVRQSIVNQNPIIVRLNSDGGKLIEGLQIGEAIRSAGYLTAIVNDAVGASTCGLVWLAGKTRYIGRKGNVGFHAACTGEGDQTRETGSGNAMIGAYLTKLGLSYGAIYVITSAPPDQTNWLHVSDSQKIRH